MMRKLSIVLVLCMLLAFFAACENDTAKDPTPTTTGKPEATTAAVAEPTKEPAKEETKTEAPETPLYEWTPRY